MFRGLVILTKPLGTNFFLPFYFAIFMAWRVRLARPIRVSVRGEHACAIHSRVDVYYHQIVISFILSSENLFFGGS